MNERTRTMSSTMNHYACDLIIVACIRNTQKIKAKKNVNRKNTKMKKINETNEKKINNKTKTVTFMRRKRYTIANKHILHWLNIKYAAYKSAYSRYVNEHLHKEWIERENKRNERKIDTETVEILNWKQKARNKKKKKNSK